MIKRNLTTAALAVQILRSYRAAWVGLLVLFAVSRAASASTIVFSDGSFAPGNYSTAFTYLQNPGSDSATWSQCSSCGNPNQALQLIINESSGGGTFNSVEVLTGILNTTFTYNPSTQGAITSIGAAVDKDFTLNIMAGFGNTFRPMIEQDGTYYVAGIAGPPLSGPGTTGYVTISNASLLAGSFFQVDPATGVIGTVNPNFAGDPMTFGIAQLLAASAVSGTTATIGYDNLDITLTTSPEPASFWTFLAGLSALAVGVRMRRIVRRSPAFVRCRAIRTIGISLLLMGAFSAPHAQAGTTAQNFTITGTGISGSGTITLATTANPAVDQIVGITGTFSTTSGGFSGAITGLSPASYSSTSPTVGAFDTYDNLFYPTGSAPGVNSFPPGGTLDDYGLDFMVAGGYTVNVFEQGTTIGFLLDDGLTSNVDHHVPITFTVTPIPPTPTPTPAPSPTPAPPSLLLCLAGLGFAGLYLAGRKVTRRT